MLDAIRAHRAEVGEKDEELDVPALEYQCRARNVTQAAKHIFAIRAASDPQVMLRVAGLFAQRGIIPDRFCARQSGDVLLIDVEVRLPDEGAARVLLEKLRSIVCVERATLLGDVKS